jgi:hypothetical protein
LDGGDGRFAAAISDFGKAVFEAVREADFRGFFDIF